MPPTRSSPSSSTRRSGPEPRPALAVLLALALAACAAGGAAARRDAWCASRFEQLDAIDFGPRPALTGGFDFRQGLIAAGAAGRCLTFGDDIAGLEGLGAGLAPRSAAGRAAFGAAVRCRPGW